MSRALHIPQFEVNQSPLGNLAADAGGARPDKHERLQVSEEAAQRLERALFCWKRFDEV